MVERLAIDRIGHLGDGIADAPSGPIFVPGALPGETVEVESVPGHPDRRQLLSVERPSAERTAPICPHFGVCGGCADAALAERALPRVEAQPRRRGAAAGRA